MVEALLTVICMIGSAAFSYAEAGLVAVSKPLVRRMADLGDDPRARKLEGLVESGLEDAVAMLAIMVTPLNLATATFVGHLTVSLLGQAYYVHTAAGSLVAVLLFCEIVPKTYASHYPDRTALSTVRWVVPLIRSLPVRVLFAGVKAGSWPVRRLLGFDDDIYRVRGFSEEELQSLVDMAEEHDVLDQAEAQMFGSIVSIGERTVREIMVPRVDMVMVDAETPLAEAAHLIGREGKSRIAVYQGVADEIIGILYATDVLRCFHAGDDSQTAADLVRDAFMVPETKPVDELFRELRQRRTHIALVIDEHGGVDGLVTMEDVLEEIIGDVRDEHDASEDQAIQQVDDDTYLVTGKTSRHDLEDLLGISFGDDNGEFDTLAGFVFLSSDGLPEPGYHVDHEGYRFQIMRMDGPRIVEIQVSRLAPTPLEGDEDD
jgi:CBS domain containing-hemolysin-like protein